MTPSQTASPTPPPPRLAVRRGSIPAYSRRRDSRFADTPSPSPLERLIKRGGRCSRVTVLPTARPAASCPAAQRWRRLVLGMVQWRPPSYRPPRPGGQVITAECTTHHTATQPSCPHRPAKLKTWRQIMTAKSRKCDAYCADDI